MSRDRDDIKRRLAAMRRSDRRRLTLLVGGLVLVLVVYFQVRSTGEPAEPDPGRRPPDILMELPDVDQEALAPVEDASEADRILLEPQPFRALTTMARALLPAHLRHLGDPALPFGQIESRSEELRGEVFRVRGELLHAETLKRTPETDPEYWCWIRTDHGDDLFFVSVQVPETLLGGENFVLADGYFFKIYTRKLPEPGTESGETRFVTAPLLIGNRLRPSYREAEPTAEVDPAKLLQVVDGRFGETVEVNQQALWHLLNVASTRAEDREWQEEMFEKAPEFDLDLLKKIAREPEVYRGKPMIVGGRFHSRALETKSVDENPLRLDFLTDGFLGSMDLGSNPIHVYAPGDYPLSTTAIQQYLAWFLQMESYTDKEGASRKTPVFVTASHRKVEAKPARYLYQILFGFIALALGLAVFLVYMIRRDKQRTRLLQRERIERRQNRATGPSPPVS